MNPYEDIFRLEPDAEKNVVVHDGFIIIRDEFDDTAYLPIIDTMVSFLQLDLSYLSRLLDADEIDFEEFTDNLRDFMCLHPYLNFFDNGFRSEEVFDEDIDIFFKYFDYLAFIHTKFDALFKFCFVQDDALKELSDLSATQRLHVFTQMEFGFIPQELRQVNALDGMVIEGFSEDKTTTPSTLEKTLRIPTGFIDYIRNFDVKLIPTYTLASTFDALTLEFYQMIETNVKLKKCKNCGEYFFVKTKRNPDYCDRIFGDGTQTCQQIMATKKFKEKNKDNTPYKIFEKYYKRYHERRKKGKIKPDVFQKWNLEACTKRDMCIDGKISFEEFEDFLYESFPNRPRK